MPATHATTNACLSMIDSPSTPVQSLSACLQEAKEQPVDLIGLLLLHPMAGAVDEVDLTHARARALLHLLDRTGRLIDAPVAPAGDEGRGHVDSAAAEHFQLAVGAAAGAHAIPVQPALET